jgi:thioredoxin 1
MEKITKNSFNEKIFNIDQKNEWSFTGQKPILIKYSADWCSPCKIMEPILEEISNEYKNKLDVYKIDIEEEFELSEYFHIKSIPSIMFIPVGNEKPKMLVGGVSKETLKKKIEEILKIS